MVSFSVDIKDTFKSVLRAVLFEQLSAMDLPCGIQNFITFITARRDLFFSDDGAQRRLCDVELHQVGILSAIFFNIYTNRLIYVLPMDVRCAMYADDLFLYTKGRDILGARDLLAASLDSVLPCSVAWAS